MTATLYIVPTPIGNLEDITLRALRVLKEVDLILAEDTRHSKKLCQHFEITTPRRAMHAHSTAEDIDAVIEKLKAGETMALISDAGTPLVSDPGAPLIVEAIKASIRIESLPGANAVTTALVASGIHSDSFQFVGFLPRKKKRKDALQRLISAEVTTIFYEAPNRLVATLEELAGLGIGERQICVARELTKKFEEFVRGDLNAALAHFREHEPRGEFCIVLAGKPDEAPEQVDEASMLAFARSLKAEGARSKECAAALCERFGIDRKRAYKLALDCQQ